VLTAIDAIIQMNQMIRSVLTVEAAIRWWIIRVRGLPACGWTICRYSIQTESKRNEMQELNFLWNA